MSCFERVDEVLGKEHPYEAIRGLAHYSTVGCGDGWVALADTVAFTNPFFSPGMTYGVGTAYEAARHTVAGLDNYKINGNKIPASVFADYQKHLDELRPALFKEQEMYFLSWNHPEVFDRVLAFRIVSGAADVVSKHTQKVETGEVVAANLVYQPTDPKSHNVLHPHYLRTVTELIELLKEGEEEVAQLAAAGKVDPKSPYR